MDALLQSRAQQLATEFASQATTVEELNELMRLMMKSGLERMLVDWWIAVLLGGAALFEFVAAVAVLAAALITGEPSPAAAFGIAAICAGGGLLMASCCGAATRRGTKSLLPTSLSASVHSTHRCRSTALSKYSRRIIPSVRRLLLWTGCESITARRTVRCGLPSFRRRTRQRSSATSPAPPHSRSAGDGPLRLNAEQPA